ncbi:MAG: TIGR04282 family arsenosugar biosynthesis glycosyltransferase [Nitrospirota bacterium]
MEKRLARKLMVVMAKEPVPGQVKTRLFPHLSPQEAAHLYLCFLQDTIKEMSVLEDIELAIAYTPEHAGKTFVSIASKNFLLFAQRGKDLGERLCNIFIEKLGEGYHAVSIINSDSPDLPRSLVFESFRLLSDHADVVFGPCDDGGYYLIGMKKVCPELFRGIPWSTGSVLFQSLEIAAQRGIKPALLPTWSDIDTFQDLIGFFNKYNAQSQNKNWAGEITFSYLLSLKKFKSIERK